jgi:pimeloyl-ACP methyl ester carboxylesterase
MGSVTTDDGVQLHVEEAGSGTPLLFVHEFAGDLRSWEPQIRHFSGRYRCVAYNARGYPPSDVPREVSSYSQARAVADAVAVLDALEIERAHVIGLSMGGFCALHLGLDHPERALSLVVAGCGYGAEPEARDGFRHECEAIAGAFRQEGSAAVAERYAVGPARVQLQNKNPDAWDLFARRLAEHSAEGAALTMLGVQRERPSLYDLTERLHLLTVPMLILAGDEDDGCLDASLLLKRTIPSAALALLPRTGHTCNLEEPEVFNAAVERFVDAVEDGHWGVRDPRSQSSSITGMSAQADEGSLAQA